jgi:glycosyltransferase involved in cell wall biosynthesis
MQEKRILHFTGMKSTKYGALERYFVELTRFCRTKGYSSIFQYEQFPQSDAYLNDLKGYGAQITATRTLDADPINAAIKITKLMFKTRPEIVHGHFRSRYTLLFIPLIARLSGVRKVLATVRTNPTPGRKSIRRFGFNCYHQIIGVSHAVSDTLIRAGVNPKIVATHYQGLFGRRRKSQKLRNQFRDEFGISSQAIVIACIAFDTPFKGLDLLLKALSQIVLDHPQLQILIIGVDPCKSALPERADKLGVNKNVHWAGIRDHGWRLLNAADLYIQPSRFGEGLSLAIMEAMALKLPIIATRVAGQAEAVINDKNGYIVEPNNLASLVGAIKRLLAEPSKWETMGMNGYQRYRTNFLGEKSIEELFEKYYKQY